MAYAKGKVKTHKINVSCYDNYSISDEVNDFIMDKQVISINLFVMDAINGGEYNDFAFIVYLEE